LFGTAGGASALADIPAVTTADELDHVLAEADRPMMVDFYTQRCGFCARLARVFARLAQDYEAKAKFAKVDVQAVPELAERFGIRGVPVVILFSAGKEVRRWIGLRDEQEYRSALDAVPAKAPEASKGAAMKERTGAVTFKGGPLTLVGQDPAVGAAAPDCAALADDLSEVRLSSFRGRVCVLATVPSLDTPVCDTQTRRFNEEAARLGGDVVILTVSMDLPFAQKRWCGAAGIQNVRTLSDHRDAAVGRAFGVLIKELRLLARAVFVLDGEGKIAYKQIVPEVTHEPDYDAALAAVRSLTRP
jgi:thiol peroxidase